MTVVSDTSVLIAFESLGKLQILKKIFQQIIIPEGVYKELKMEEIRKLEERINFRLSRDLKQYIKEQAGE